MRRLRFALLPAALLLSIGLVVTLRWVIDNRVSNFDGRADVYVTPDTGLDEIVAQIDAGASIRRAGSLERMFRRKKVDVYKCPGHYVVSSGQSSAYVARMLNNGWQTPVNLTLSGSLKLKDKIACKISSQLMLSEQDILTAMNDAAFLEKYCVTPQTVFSLIIADTYQVYWDVSVEELFDRLYRESQAFWTETRREKASKLGLSPLQVYILASIVCGESNYGPELPKIAGVYLNRLKKGMPLQADPTVAFCYDYSLNRVLKTHLRINSPYNTYKYRGLPPGPICAVSPEYVDAVLNPDYGPGNIYFCANSDFSGTHLFARTSAQHAANARAYQKELNRRAAAKRADANKNKN